MGQVKLNDLFAKKQCKTFEEATDTAVLALKKQLIKGKLNDIVIGNVPAVSYKIKFVKKMVNIDRCLDNLEEGQFDLLIGFVHKDAAASFFVTFYHILNTKSLALVFHPDAEKLEVFEETIKDSTDAEIVSARAYHNPTPIRVRLDRALKPLEAM